VEGGPYHPPPHKQMIIDAICYLQCALIGGVVLAEFVLQRPPAPLKMLQDNRMAVIVAVVALNSISGTLMKTGAFEVEYNGDTLWSKVKTDDFPPPGEVVRALSKLMAK